MYYEDLGIYFHDTGFFNTENPVVRDELWKWQETDLGYESEEIEIHIEFNISALKVDESELEQAIEAVLRFSYDNNYCGEIDTGEREIVGCANRDTYHDLIDILYYYCLDFTDKSE